MVLADVLEGAFQGYRMLKEFATWPRPGGWLRQAAKFLTVVDFCDRASALYEARKREKEAELRRMQAEMEKAMKNVSWQR